MKDELNKAPARVFDKVWQARAHAIALHLSEAGHFSWSSWARTLGEELRRVEAGPDCGEDGYYIAWQRALERLLIESKLIKASDFEHYRSAWSAAFQRTAHGQPVELVATDFER
jgi:nitrile hydratase accessory protein